MAENHFFFKSAKPALEKDQLISELRSFAPRASWSQAIANEIELILEEWWTNLINYALTEVSNPVVTVEIQSDGEYATLEIQDSGAPFNPANYPDPDLSLPVEERPVGGLGIYMMKKLSSNLKYERRGDRNVLLIRKDLTRQVLGR